MKDLQFFDNYSNLGDLIVILLCISMFIIIGKSFIKNKYNFVLFKTSLLLLVVCASSNIALHIGFDLTSSDGRLMTYIFKDINYISAFSLMVAMILYVSNLITSSIGKSFYVFLIVLFVGCSLFTIFTPITKLGFNIDVNGVIHENYICDIYRVAYLAYTGVLLYMLVRYRHNISKPIYVCLVEIFTLTFLIMVFQSIIYDTSYITITFLLPLVAILFLVYSNPYDFDTGALDVDSFYIKLNEYISKDASDIVLLSFNIPGLDEKLQQDEIAFKFFRFYDNYIKHGCLFRVSDSRLILMFKKSENIDFGTKVIEMCTSISRLQCDYGLDYKVVEFENIINTLTPKEYIGLIKFIENKQRNNSVYIVQDEDINNYKVEKCIEEELHEIVNSGNLDDERVIVLCQPIFNVQSGQFRTAEALMRFRSNKLGIVYPDVFIPVAERVNCIHFLSLIILNKVCKTIKQLIVEGYNFDRISVNFSIIELKNSKFCNDVISIVKMNDIPFSKVAIELTETMNDSDYDYMRARITSLKSLGISFYLDDFGTGYSNFDRILKLPVDTIKFDRSLLLLSSQDTSYKSLVENFVSIFKTLNYSVLFEGVEDEEAESYCMYAKADYLQGYKYSKPIPIDDLRKFLIQSTNV